MTIFYQLIIDTSTLVLFLTFHASNLLFNNNYVKSSITKSESASLALLTASSLTYIIGSAYHVIFKLMKDYVEGKRRFWFCRSALFIYKYSDFWNDCNYLYTHSTFSSMQFSRETKEFSETTSGFYNNSCFILDHCFLWNRAFHVLGNKRKPAYLVNNFDKILISQDS